MQSVKTFAKAVLPSQPGIGEKYTTFPLDWSTQLLRLSATTSRPVSLNTIATPRDADFYEYYWADKVEGTELSDLVKWFIKLLFKRPPHHLWPIWILTWLISVVAFALVVMFRAGQLKDMVSYVPPILGVLIALLWAFALKTFLIDYLGDAARYLDPKPKNKAVREAITKDGTDLLQQLIDSRRQAGRWAHSSLCPSDKRRNDSRCYLGGTARRIRPDFRISAEVTASNSQAPWNPARGSHPSALACDQGAPPVQTTTRPLRRKRRA